MDILSLLASPEGKTVEFKRDASSLKPILRTLVAFANTAGGTLAVGREDDGRIRNRVIARVLRELGLVEEWGTGYLRITEACREGGYPAPEWEEHGACLRAVFRPHPEVERAGDVPENAPGDDRINDRNDRVNDRVNEPDTPVDFPANVSVNERQRWLLSQLARGDQVKAADVMTQFAVSEMTARRDLAALRDLGLIEFVGAPKTGHYRLTEQR